MLEEKRRTDDGDASLCRVPIHPALCVSDRFSYFPVPLPVPASVARQDTFQAKQPSPRPSLVRSCLQVPGLRQTALPDVVGGVGRAGV